MYKICKDTCKESGGRIFDTKCTALGTITAAETCYRVSCSRPPTVLFAMGDTSEMLYKDKAKYECMEGYTTTGKADGDTKFSLECEKDGSFTSPKPKCMPVSC